MDARERSLIRRNESAAALKSTDLRDIASLSDARKGKVTDDTDWVDPFIRKFRDYLENDMPKERPEAKLWSSKEILKQLKNFIEGKIPMEPSSQEDKIEAMNRIDASRDTAHSALSSMKDGIEYIPTPTLRGGIRTLLRSIRQHSNGMGGKV